MPLMTSSAFRWQVGVAVLMLLALGQASAFDAGSVHQANCASCHARITGGDGHLLYVRPDRIAQSPAELTRRVKYCGRGAGLAWETAQVAQMANWLGQYYQWNESESVLPN